MAIRPSEGGVSPLPDTYNDQLRHKVSELWLMARRLTDELENLVMAVRSHRHFDAMFRCLQAGESWQDAMDTGCSDPITDQQSVVK